MRKVQRREHITDGKGKPSGKRVDPWTGIRQAGLLKRQLPGKPLWVLLAILFILSAAASHATPLRTVTATITKITDGDTVQAVTPEGTKLKVRLYGIDAPETAKGKIPGEPFGNASRKHLAALVNQQTVTLEIRDIDRYRRMVAILWLAERNVNQEMIAAGMAEAYREYLKKPYRTPFIQAEQEARAQGKGIWSQGDRYERPSQFRKRMGS
jgi:endonuclease YncB( thermonuclease family)